MFVDGGGGWRPPPWQPPRRGPRMTKRQEKVLLWIIVFNALMLLVAPVGGVTIVQPLSALFAAHRASDGAGQVSGQPPP